MRAVRLAHRSLPAGFSPALIKLDVEGAEEAVLRGGITTITRSHPVVVFECIRDGLRSPRESTVALLDLLCGQAGMRVFDVFGAGPYDLDSFYRTVHARRISNFVALP